MIQKDRRNSDLITISREFYDLTHIINKNIPVYPGDPKPTFEPVTTIGKDANTNITRITMGSHTGTHVDAHKHFIPNGIGIDKEPPDKFIGEAVVLDMSHNSKWARNYKFGFGKECKYSKIWRYCFTLYWYKSQIVFQRYGK